MRVVWAEPALDHLEEIADYIARDNPSAAYRLVDRIHQKTNSLITANPRTGRRGRDPETRELLIAGTPYIVVYRTRPSKAEILAVIFGGSTGPASDPRVDGPAALRASSNR